MIEVCEECGVPTMVSGGLNWKSNGVISLAASPRNRMVFFESETLDRIFGGIGELVGMPIEHIIIESRRRETKRYIERAFPPEVRRLIDSKESSLEDRMARMSPGEKETLYATMRVVTQSIIDIARNYGYGQQRLSELWESGEEFPWRTQLVEDPYSILFISADNLGSVEAFEGVEMQVRYERTGENKFRTEVFPGQHALELEERLKRRRYDFKPGDISYDRCPQCGIPKTVSRRIWDLEKGTIIDGETSRRMAIFGPFSIDSICDDLEGELGDAVPAAVIESTRRYIRSAWSLDNWNRDGLTFQQMIAVRGLGNLVRFEGDREHLEMRIENACLHLPMAGAVQALVELAYRAESSTTAWELSEGGDLDLTITVKR
ncbi:MAG: hypothetical protein JW854_11185 [Actinobacteria bacterium]|nr:hypothetical protein [Actinomycetota bacterium]